MRVAVHLPAGHPHSPQADAVVAYKLGRIRDGVDNHIIHTGETVPVHEFAAALVAQAKADYPQDGVKVVVERLVDNGDGTGRWVADADFDANTHTLAPPGNSASAEFHVESEGAV